MVIEDYKKYYSELEENKNVVLEVLKTEKENHTKFENGIPYFLFDI